MNNDPLNMEHITVLIVDDEPDFTELMCYALRAAPYTVVTFNEPNKAIEYMDSHAADILVTDVRMAGMNGYELMTAAQMRCKGLAVIAVTAHGQVDMAVDFMKQGAVDFLQKPVDNMDIRMAIDKAAYGIIRRKKLIDQICTKEASIHAISVEMEKSRQREKELRIHVAELEKKLREKEQSEERIIIRERLAALGEMARGVAHDFNNALQPIMLAAGFVATNPEHLLEQGVLKDYLDEMVIATQEAAETVSKLVKFYSPIQRASEQVLDLKTLIADVIDMTHPRWKNEAQAEGRTIYVNFDAPDSCFVLGHYDALQEMIINLLFNAVDAIEEKGEIQIRVHEEADEVVIEVSDNGRGMNEDMRQHCMEPFKTSRTTKGSGLGMSIVYGVVQKYHGRMTVSSEMGRGTVVRILLPILSERISVPEPSKRDEAPPLPPFTPIEKLDSVLLVEDEPSVREMVQRFLEQSGIHVLTAENGVDACDLFSKFGADVVMTDQAMPEMTGSRMAEHIRMLSPQTPIIMITGFADVLEGTCPAVNYILHKPVTAEQIQQAIQAVTVRRNEG